MTPFKLIITSFLPEKYMFKINKNETKPKQSQWDQNCWKHWMWSSSEPVALLISFMGAYNSNNRKFEFE